MGDVWTTPTIDSAKRAGEGLPMGGPGDDAPGFLDSLGLGWKIGRAAPDWGYNQRNYEEQIAFDLYKPLLEKGYLTRPLDDSVAGRIARSFRGKEDPFWAARAKAEADGVALPHGAVIDAGSMKAEALRLRRADMESAMGRLQNGSTAGALTGELLAGVVDPLNLVPVGGATVRGAGLARSILMAGRNAALGNMALGVAIEPLVRDDAEALGMPRTMANTATDLAVMGTAGFVLGGLAGGVQHALGSRARAVPVGDDGLISEFDQLVPRANQTGEEKAAASVLEQATAEARLSPFVPGPAGDDVHAERMSHARDWAFGMRLPPAQPVRRVSPGEVAGGVTANLRHGERARYKAKVRGAESSGNDLAKASSSSAYGRYQPIKSTWLNWYQQRYPGSGLTPDQIYAKRADGALQEVFMDDFTAANAAALRRAGLAETADNLYMAHFLGAADAVKVLAADADAPIAGLVRPKSIAANRRVLEGKTVGEVRQWAASKMGGEASGSAPVRVTEAEAQTADIDVTMLTRSRAETDPWARMSDDVPEGGWIDDPDMPRLRPDLFTTPEAHARTQIAMEADMDAREGFDIFDRWTSADEAANGAIVVGPRRAPPKGPMDLLQFLASKGGLIPTGIAPDSARPGAARFGHDLPGHFGENPFIPGGGKLLRDNGLALDDARELAVEAGYFGDPNRTDVTVADLLEAMDRQHRSGDRAFSGADAREMEARRSRLQADDGYQEFVDRLDAAASARGLDGIAQEDALRAFELWDGNSFDATLDRVIAEKLRQASDDAAAEAEAFQWREPVDYTTMPRSPEMEETGGMTAQELTPWDDPDGAASDMQLMSIEHDLRVWADEQPDMAFPMDEGGEPRSLADIMTEIDEEEAAIAAMEACL